jgi:hypothetical protein
MLILITVLAWSNDSSQRVILAFSTISTFQVKLLAGDSPAFSVQLMVYIRDTRDCITEQNLALITVRPDTDVTSDLLRDLQDPSSSSKNNPLIRSLTSGNQNTIGQTISVLSQQFNQIKTEQIDDAVSSLLSSH